jgi:[ribosomal protein S18]-alanine N-acetyltransferase
VDREPEVTFERLSDPDDLAAVAALEAACFSQPWTAEMRARELAHSDVARLYVLRTPTARVAAFCACWVIVDELHINTIAVDPARRRQGLARRLMEHVCADAAAAGARHATLEVRRSNEAALGLYRRLGFTVRAVRPRYYSDPEEDGLILSRDEVDELR